MTAPSMALSSTAASRSNSAMRHWSRDKSERDRVRDSFLKKKLGLTLPDAELDKAVIEVCERMKAERDKPRVTFYYQLAEKFDKLSAFA